MPGNSGNKSNKPKLHGSTNSLRDTFNQALNEATTAEQARSEANLGEGHSAKSNNTDFADLREWYAKLDHDTKSAMDKAADKPTSRFTNEERDNFYLKVDPYHYLQYLQFRYPNKTEFIQSRMHSYYGFRRHLEENGIAPKKSAETKPETQYAEQAVKEQAKSEKSAEEKALDDVWADSLGIPRSELNSAKPNTASQPAANPEKQTAKQMVENAKAPAEQTKSEKPSGGATTDVWFADALKADMVRLDAERAEAKRKAEEEAERVKAEKQAAQDMVDSSKPAKKNEQPAWVTTPWRETMYRLGDNTPEINPPEKYEPSSNSLWDFPELAVSRGSASKVPNYLNDAYARKAERDRRKQDPRINLGYYPAPARYNSLSSILGRNEPMLMGLTAAGVLGLGGLGLYGRYKYGDINQPQTQVPYRMEPEPEPVNEAVAQSELTPEQQFVLQSTSPFDYAKGINLFDLYDRYGSPDSIDNSIPEEQSVDENTPQPDSDTYRNAQEMGQRIASGTGYAPELKEDNFEFPQNPPEVGSNIKTAGLKSPNGGDVPQELNRLSGVKPKIIKDTSKGPVVLNDPNHRKTRNVQNNPVTPEQAAASQMVNQYAGIPVEVVRAKNQPFLTTDAIWNRLRQKGLVSPEEGIRSGLFTPDEVRYITENDLWRYR